MVHKRIRKSVGSSRQFENDVKMYGTQACFLPNKKSRPFENDVKMYGTQAE